MIWTSSPVGKESRQSRRA